MTKDKIVEASEYIEQIRNEIRKRIVGMDKIVERTLVAFFANGHVLLEGVPGVGKTFLLRTIAEVQDAEFGRIQFTPDLRPHELLQKVELTGPNEFEFKHGPVFANIVLADEINRGLPKTNSALLEAMEERQVTLVSEGTVELPKPFLVVATQNPVENEGTYELLEAQRDRFLMKLFVGYPSHEESVLIAKNKKLATSPVNSIISAEEVLEFQGLVDGIYIDDNLVEDAVNLAELTRPENFPYVEDKFEFGASTRAPIALVSAAKALAFVRGRDHVLRPDLYELASPVLCHRVIFKSHHYDKTKYHSIFNDALNHIELEVFGERVLAELKASLAEGAENHESG